MKHLVILSFLLCVGFIACDTHDNLPIENLKIKKPKLPVTTLDYATDMAYLEFENAIANQLNNMRFGISGTATNSPTVDIIKTTNSGITHETVQSADELKSKLIKDKINEKATLGRVLFYDKSLSLNNAVSCGSCHHQDKAFADGKKRSEGFKGLLTSRNSMAINNPLISSNLFWDSRSLTALDLALQPVMHHIEMGMLTSDQLVQKLNSLDYYQPLVSKAFGEKTKLDAKMVSTSIAEFVNSLTSYNSKFDQQKKVNFKDFSQLESLGKEIFFSDKAKCATCHDGFNFSLALQGSFNDYTGGFDPRSNMSPAGTANIGLVVLNNDKGRGGLNRFKIPSLRNVALTGPYMHDGRFKSLEEVIDHYSAGIQNDPLLDKNLKDFRGHAIKLNFSTLEKQALIAFLNTLTDTKLVSDPKYADPFSD